MLKKGGGEMQRHDYCVYNQTNECFLSLGATLGDGPFARLKQRFHIGRRRADEGSWFKPYQPQHALTMFNTRDLLYLDAAHRVVHIVESYPGLRVVPQHQDAVSLLSLPVHTISSSQTKVGNQLLICVPTEMERKLRKLFEPKRSASQQPVAATPRSIHSFMSQPEEPVVRAAVIDTKSSISVPVVTVPVHRNRQVAVSPAVPVADGGELSMHAIRDLSATGLYLITRDRWPIGAEINMNLQPGGGASEDSISPITVRMRVTSWGSDGVSLEFSGAAAESSDPKSLYVC
jgi:hypothetical protein